MYLVVHIIHTYLLEWCRSIYKFILQRETTLRTCSTSREKKYPKIQYVYEIEPFST